MKITPLVLTLFAVSCFTAPVFAQDEAMGGSEKADRKAKHEEMQAEMKAMDEKLDRLVIDMNAAGSPDQRIAAAVAVINEMVAQHKKMHSKMHQWDGPRGHHGHGEGKANEAKQQNKP